MDFSVSAPGSRTVLCCVESAEDRVVLNVGLQMLVRRKGSSAHIREYLVSLKVIISLLQFE